MATLGGLRLITNKGCSFVNHVYILDIKVFYRQYLKPITRTINNHRIDHKESLPCVYHYDS